MNNNRIIEHVIETLELVINGEKSKELLNTAIEQLRDAQRINEILNTNTLEKIGGKMIISANKDEMLKLIQLFNIKCQETSTKNRFYLIDNHNKKVGEYNRITGESSIDIDTIYFNSNII